ncbi:precorrin-6y C5,15-methyltransferase (decarboxylating) subunit CbiE [Crocosphaera sp. XPORK-15E]|uniref:precorrin-6y C5,15-methyltransferase (decarboxylating) subunit CbiE n=1 Tax=Crocosphaera sp. XPORK-15E TaxID=3110247 RepID=UPI002B20F784|nr:precorrin-6y C5,15-methyltransferase (decarboxylating) subunit CbiE [Crocosphaera sp. XPORK-15E]MEA5536482.1 precorrin-6y C5,15-methyltransferase (decarboxylating) subunit CbiE [Crocosphaera sp. XPORK-15E]
MINVVGIGLNGQESLIENTRKLVEDADLLLGSDRHLSYFPNHPAKKIISSNFLADINSLKQTYKSDQSVVILVSGDPLFFGLGRLLLEHFESQELEFYPHLSCLQLAFSRVKIPWHDAKLISGHGRHLDELISSLQQGLEKIAVLTDSINNPQAIACLYLSLNIPINYEIWVCENLGDTKEKITCFSPQDLSTSNPDQFAVLNLVILLRKNSLELDKITLDKLPLFGIEDRYFLTFEDRPGLMTKREIRMIILGELCLKPPQIIWDIGAGTGSVSVEIARLCPTSQVYAVEKTAMGITLINKNSQRFKVNNITSIQGKAPDILNNLPNPDRIFIGGSGGNLVDILEVCQQKLTQQGMIIIAVATLENLGISLNWLKNKGWDYQLLDLHIARSVSLANLTRFSPLNPVTLIQGKKPVVD